MRQAPAGCHRSVDLTVIECRSEFDDLTHDDLVVHDPRRRGDLTDGEDGPGAEAAGLEIAASTPNGPTFVMLSVVPVISFQIVVVATTGLPSASTVDADRHRDQVVVGSRRRY